MIPFHPVFKGGEGFDVLRLRVEFPFMHRPAIITHTGVTVTNTTLAVQEPELSFFHIVQCIKLLHEP